MGIPSNATLLYGHIETYAERVQHMLRLRDLEDEAPGFFAFIPLEFQTGYTTSSSARPPRSRTSRRSRCRGSCSTTCRT